MHEGPKFDCECCGKSFSQAEKLTKHIQATHESKTNLKRVGKVKCENCNRWVKECYKRLHDVKKHGLIYEKSMCDKCNKWVFDIGKKHALKKYDQFTLNSL